MPKRIFSITELFGRDIEYIVSAGHIWTGEVENYNNNGEAVNQFKNQYC